MYKKAQSTIFTNGHFSATFPISRSVRQGSPLGPYLYIMQSEPLAQAVRKHPNIHGIEIGNGAEKREIKICAYADDTQAFVRDRVSMETWFHLF